MVLVRNNRAGCPSYKNVPHIPASLVSTFNAPGLFTSKNVKVVTYAITRLAYSKACMLRGPRPDCVVLR